MKLNRNIHSRFQQLLVLSFLLFGLTNHQAAQAEEVKRPNIIVLVADDMGFTDIGPLGGEIPTPNINAIADEGLTFTRMYTSPVCSPSRAMLLTGMDNHLIGLGNMDEFMTDNQRGKPGYEGYLNDKAATIAEVLQEADYNTYFTGKWHLGNEVDLSPRAKGFDRSFTILTGAGSHFDDQLGYTVFKQRANYREDGKRVHKLPEDFYSSDYYTDRMLDYIDENLDDGKPFFGYLAYTAPHWPLQVPNKYLDKYKGMYNEGYEVLRAKRFENLKALGVIDQNLSLPALPEKIQSWDELTKEVQMYEARVMEMYAGMVNNMDDNIGRLIKYLKRKGEYENTFILFLSDNGADGMMRLFDFKASTDYIAQFDHSFEAIGTKGSYNLYHSGWAAAGEAPFRFFKGMLTEGGVRKMAISKAPNQVVKGKNSSAITLQDMMPTILEVAGVKHPGTRFRGRDVLEPTGLSFNDILNGSKDAIRDENDVIGMELTGQRAIIKGDWKLVWIRDPFNKGWELYNVVEDPAEQNNLADINTKKYEELLLEWDKYMATNNVILPEGPIRIVN